MRTHSRLRHGIMTTLLLLTGGLPPWDAGPSHAATAQNPHGTLDIECEACHVTDSWTVSARPKDFDHARTGYLLEGRHRSIACAGCHADPMFSRVGIACADCHLDVHRAELGSSCEGCHSPTGWDVRNESIERHARTRFPLMGAHAVADCEACHVGVEPTEFASTPVACGGCHRDTYAATTEPDHGLAGFESDCEICHPPAARGWAAPSYVHPQSFALLGIHATTDCSECHNPVFAGTSVLCIDCHEADYIAAVDPDHDGGSLPHTCEDCHGFSGWAGADFNHDVHWPLTGAHRSVACLTCHDNGYSGTPSECIGCHQTEYDATTDPDHVATGFGQDCETCHNTIRWDDTDWDHDILFPIYSGKHRNEWDACVDCHVTAQDYAIFECIFCHEHRQSEVDDEHSEVDDYVYTSAGCFDCHPRGDN